MKINQFPSIAIMLIAIVLSNCSTTERTEKQANKAYWEIVGSKENTKSVKEKSELLEKNIIWT